MSATAQARGGVAPALFLITTVIDQICLVDLNGTPRPSTTLTPDQRPARPADRTTAN